MRRIFAAGLFLLLTGVPALAQRSIGDCEKIADPDAYNRCLAAFGPAARSKAGTPAAAAAPAATEQAPTVRSRDYRGKRRYAARGWRKGKAYARSRQGRVRMTFNVGRGGSRKWKRHRGRRR